MKRRKFIYDSSLIAFTIGVFGKVKWDGNSFVGNDPTTTDILGPFYRPNAPFKTDLVQAGTKGQIIYFTGIIYDKNKQPIKNSLVEIWHCNENGEYDNTSDKYIYRASAHTGADGKYDFRTILPVPYAVSDKIFRPAHIHMRISGTGHEQDLVTQVYFKGDKNIPGDPSSSDPRSLNRILEVSTNSKNEKTVKFDIYLRQEYVLDDAAFKKIVGLYQMNDKSMVEFYRNGDQLFAKANGQIIDSMDYKGNNNFEGGLGQSKAHFELLENGGAKVKGTILEEKDKWITVEGTKLLKY